MQYWGLRNRYLQNVCSKFFGRGEGIDGPVPGVAVGGPGFECQVHLLLVGPPLQDGGRELAARVGVKLGCKLVILG